MVKAPAMVGNMTLPVTVNVPPLDAEALAAPFTEAELEYRVLRSTTMIRNGEEQPLIILTAYVDARAIHARLDTLVGPARWQVEQKAAPNGLDGVLVGLSLLTEFGWVTKWDGADAMKGKGGDDNPMDVTKGTLSSAFKRAASLWGIGRYLYQVPTLYAEWHPASDRSQKRSEWYGSTKVKLRDGTRADFLWRPKPMGTNGGIPKRFIAAEAPRGRATVPPPEPPRAVRTPVPPAPVPTADDDRLPWERDG